jgi:hypothetical protein
VTTHRLRLGQLGEVLPTRTGTLGSRRVGAFVEDIVGPCNERAEFRTALASA